MATVHVGRLIGPVDFSRTVAIKRLHPHVAKDPMFVSMFMDEARLSAAIRHPNVMPTLDIVAAGDELFVVMEYVPGESLSQLIAAGKEAGKTVPFPFALSIITQTLHGLHAAHEARDRRGNPLEIVHRDVSPQNILVGVDGVARVLDFGIAKAASRGQNTTDGQIKGKLAYMSSEQLQQGRVDRRTDIFAASIVLWELLAGERLFSASDSGATVARILTGKVDPPSGAMLATKFPLALDAIVLRGLSRDPKKRFQTAEEMATVLENVMQVPRAREIGAWVEETAKVALRERADVV
ncbi:MAG: serine/threonine-protein kinase, partial [Polyangiaceae bacterium]